MELGRTADLFEPTLKILIAFRLSRKKLHNHNNALHHTTSKFAVTIKVQMATFVLVLVIPRVAKLIII